MLVKKITVTVVAAVLLTVVPAMAWDFMPLGLINDITCHGNTIYFRFEDNTEACTTASSAKHIMRLDPNHKDKWLSIVLAAHLSGKEITVFGSDSDQGQWGCVIQAIRIHKHRTRILRC